MCFMIIINIGFRPLVFHDCDPHDIKVVYDHTRIASYRRGGVGNVARQVWLLALEGEQMLRC
jgi:hypothetical protein